MAAAPTATATWAAQGAAVQPAATARDGAAAASQALQYVWGAGERLAARAFGRPDPAEAEPPQGVEVAARRAGDPSGTRLAVFANSVLEVLRRQLAEVQKLPIVTKFQDSPLHHTLPVFSVCTIMGTLYVSFAWIYLPALHLSPLCTHSVAFHTCFCLSVASYHQGLVVDPGGIPDTWCGEPDGKPVFALQTDTDFQPTEKKKSTGSWRYCNKERKFKPDRAHFCTPMQRNVLRMDHYCPWLVNCVGFQNHKFFLLFLFYTVLATNITAVDLYRALWLYRAHLTAGSTVMMAQSTFLCSLLSVLLTPFFGFHCWLLGNNMTTLEYCEKKGVVGSNWESVYDVGLWENVSSVMGREWYLWLLPVGGPRGDGIRWTINQARLSGDDGEQEAERVPSRTRQPLAVLADHLERPALLAGKVKRFVEQHPAVPRMVGGAAEAFGELGEDLAVIGSRLRLSVVSALQRWGGARGWLPRGGGGTSGDVSGTDSDVGEPAASAAAAAGSGSCRSGAVLGAGVLDDLGDSGWLADRPRIITTIAVTRNGGGAVSSSSSPGGSGRSAGPPRPHGADFAGQFAAF